MPYTLNSEIPVICNLRLVTSPLTMDEDTKYITRVYRFGTVVHTANGGTKEEAHAMAIDWIYDNHTVPDEYAVHIHPQRF